MDKWPFRESARNFARLYRKAKGMNDLSLDPRPGDNASPQDVLVLANQYALAFKTLNDPHHGKAGFMRAPAGLCVIHAIELYLSVAIRLCGGTPSEVRKYQHNLADMAAHEGVTLLGLRKKTSEHLATMRQQNEYVVVRYGPEMCNARSELTQLEATLNELACKVGTRFDALNSPYPSGICNLR